MALNTPPIAEIVISYVVGVMLSPFSWGLLVYILFAIIMLAIRIGCTGDVLLSFGIFCVSFYGFITGRTILLNAGVSPIDSNSSSATQLIPDL